MNIFIKGRVIIFHSEGGTYISSRGPFNQYLPAPNLKAALMSKLSCYISYITVFTERRSLKNVDMNRTWKSRFSIKPP